MPTATSDLIARFARVYLTNRPSDSTLSTYVDRVNSGAITLTQALGEFHNSSDRSQGAADEVTKLFFIMFGRAPDYTTYRLAMNLLEAGTSFIELCNLAMNVRGGQLNSTQTNTAFIDTLSSQMFDQPQYVNGMAALKNSLVVALNQGVMTRAEILSLAAAYQHDSLKFKDNIGTALIAMAAAGREATAAELDLYQDVSPMIAMREILSVAGESPYGLRPYFTIAAGVDDALQLKLSGTITGIFNLNLNTKISSIVSSSANSTYTLVYSPDGGASESIVRYRSSLLPTIDSLDASELIVTSLTSLSVTLPNRDFQYIGANKPNTVQAGSGDDFITGGSDADVLYGAAGDDSLTGGAGADTFVFAPASVYRASSDNQLTVTDFGFGADKLSFNRAFGKTTAAAAVSPILAFSDPLDDAAQVTLLNTLAANGVVLIRNNGGWVDDDGQLIAATAEDIATTFDGVVLTDTSNTSKSYAVITFDIVNGADVWLVSNFTGLTTIIESEIRLIGHVDGHEGADLLTQLQTSGSIVA